MKNDYQKTFINYLYLQRVAPKTRRAYLQSIKGLTTYHKLPADQLTNDQIQEYLLYRIKEKKSAWSTCNVIFSGLKKFYHGFLGRDNTGFSIPPRPRSHQLPMLLSRDEVSSILKAPGNLKHQALLAIIYGSGLRVSEAVSLRAEHIESKRMLVRIEQSKGRKDRYTILSKSCLELLREYWRTYQPGKWLFFTKDKNRPMPSETAQKIYHLAKQKAGVTRGRGIHTLRHCFATHALEQGVQLFILKRWLGHASIKTTCIYLHASTPPTRPGGILYCTLPPVTVPKAAPIPGVAELDPTTGLHYTGSGKTIHIDLETYRLKIDGMVDFPLKLSYDDLRCLPKIEVRTTIVCKGNFDDTAVWAGASLKYVLELAGIQAQAKNIRLISADNYEASITREEAMSGKAFLAYEWEKQPVPIIHGFPVRVALPGLLGGNWVKWLVKIEVY